MPALFIGHGHPMNALWDNAFTQRLTALNEQLDKPNAILVISAHWLTRGAFVSSTNKPETIYDFGNFDEQLFKINYPAPGAPEYAKLVKETISTAIELDDAMGLDHGTWSILKYIFPKADVPVFQLSIDITKSPQWHYALAVEIVSFTNFAYSGAPGAG